MGWRKTNKKTKPEFIEVMTCDVCNKDIGLPDGFNENAHYEVEFKPGMDLEPDAETERNVLCSVDCLEQFVIKEKTRVRTMLRSVHSL